MKVIRNNIVVGHLYTASLAALAEANGEAEAVPRLVAPDVYEWDVVRPGETGVVVRLAEVGKQPPSNHGFEHEFQSRLVVDRASQKELHNAICLSRDDYEFVLTWYDTHGYESVTECDAVTIARARALPEVFNIAKNYNAVTLYHWCKI